MVSKSTTGTIHPNLLIALRFLIAFAVLGIIFFKRLKQINPSYIVSGLVIGFCFWRILRRRLGLQKLKEPLGGVASCQPPIV